VAAAFEHLPASPSTRPPPRTRERDRARPQGPKPPRS
jgi:hypothetical protein